MENGCLFCKIVQKESPATIIFENEHVLAFLTIHPVNLGHTLVIPKTHSQNLYDTPDEHLANVMSASKKIALAMKRALNAEGVNIINNTEKSAGQVIFHTHFHVIPRFHDDGFMHWHGSERNPEEMLTVAAKITSALEV